MAVSKVEFGGETLVDLTSDTVDENNLLSGAVAHDASGESVEGKVFVTEVVRITQEEYDELPDSKLTDGKIYFIKD